MTFSERLDGLLEINNLTQKAIAENAGIRYASISDWKNSGSFPRADVALKIAQMLGTTVEYLVAGKFPEGIEPKVKDMARKIMALSAQDRDEIQFLLEHKILREQKEKIRKGQYTISQASAGYAAEAGAIFDSETRETPPPYLAAAKQTPLSPGQPNAAATSQTEGFDNVEAIDYDMVGILYLGDYAATAAGELREMLDDPGEHQIRYLPRNLIKADPEECFCLPVHGTSMTQVGISDGDVVVLKMAEMPENGAIMLVSYEGKSTLKKIAVKKEKVFLQWKDGSGTIEEINKEGYQVLGKLILILKPPSKNT